MLDKETTEMLVNVPHNEINQAQQPFEALECEQPKNLFARIFESIRNRNLDLTFRS